ncbi:HET-domain-containing protein [Aulographum hederae CBS 113979]|uniref:HET-domain-containing protein n=1 Tax=Aulographum hederae CBS 113979 TaxID=1176131 RepID=A0A6G1GQY8_9PEZI|nr:HET-domain-containing protein [Aulographum hederae CBS 113979]
MSPSIPKLVSPSFLVLSTQTYTYQPLKHHDEIRLLAIEPSDDFSAPIKSSILHVRVPHCRCIFQHTTRNCDECRDVEPFPEYRALSYTWGMASKAHQILCDDKWLWVTYNCHAALLRLRQTSTRPVWVDAICIDQDTIRERNHQVRLMSRIYRAAEEVVIYLGEAKKKISIAFRFLKGLEISSVAELHALQSILARPYFTRIWVIQEVAWAWSATVLCGDHNVPWCEFWRSVCNDMVAPGRMLPFVLSMNPGLPTHGLHGVETPEFSPRKLLEILCKTRSCLASDPRDKVFALLTLFPPFDQSDLPIQANYHLTAAEVFSKVAEYLIRSLGTLLLSAVVSTPGKDDLPHISPSRSSPVAKLPSWVPDWSRSSSRPYLYEPWKSQSQPSTSKNMVIPSNTTGKGPIISLCPADITNKSASHSSNKSIVSVDSLNPQESVVHVRSGSILSICSLYLGSVVDTGPSYSSAVVHFPDTDHSLFLNLITDLIDIHQNIRQRNKDRMNEVFTRDDNSKSVHDSLPRFHTNFDLRNVPSPADLRDSLTGSRWVAPKAQVPILDFRGDSHNWTANILYRYGALPRLSDCLCPPGKDMTKTEKLEPFYYRRLFYTNEGYVGLGPQEMRKGDVVCLFLDSNIPFILRKVKNGFVLVGECILLPEIMEAVVETFRRLSTEEQREVLCKVDIV